MRQGDSDFLVEKFVLHLVEARKAQGLSINKLAWMSGVSPKAIAFIEQGVHSPTLKTFFRLTVALKLDLSKTLQQIMDSKPKSGDQESDDTPPQQRTGN